MLKLINRNRTNKELFLSIIFITNTDLNHRKGGWDGLGGKIYDLLHDRLENFTGIDQINPPVFKLDLIKYRLQKEFNFLRIFPAYSIRRLNVISDLLASHQQQTFEHILFHGSTPWSSYTPEVPYSTILDCCFSTYIKTYHNISHFNSDYLKRIINLDRSFLQKAHAVFFTSHWAMNQTCQDYQMTGDNFVYIGQGPSIDFIENNFSALKDQFLFIATESTGYWLWTLRINQIKRPCPP